MCGNVGGMYTDDRRLLTDSQMAARLGVRVGWLRERFAGKDLPGVWAGHRWLCDPEAVEAKLLELARASGEPKPAPCAASPTMTAAK